MDALTAAPSEKKVQEYVSILKNVDWQTGLRGVATLVVGFAAVRAILHLAKKALKASHIPASLHTVLWNLLRIILDLVVILAAAGTIGIPITSFITLLGIAGLAVSLALQGVLSNLAGGFIILSTHPFDLGHFIEHDGVTGTVREISMQHTRLETPDGKMIYIPNSRLSGGRIINYSETGKRRVELTVSASYGHTPAQVRSAVMAAVERTEGILSDPAPAVYVDGYGESDIKYGIWAWTEGANFLRVRRELTELLYTTFAEKKVEMTYPHLNVHLKQN
ncbi:MAG: mechanosensitive ion channel family protein [Clostridia bacterium]|nr:mechanosensitive ion channel family protein [Clostridia bacterium]